MLLDPDPVWESCPSRRTLFPLIFSGPSAPQKRAAFCELQKARLFLQMGEVVGGMAGGEGTAAEQAAPHH